MILQQLVFAPAVQQTNSTKQQSDMDPQVLMGGINLMLARGFIHMVQEHFKIVFIRSFVCLVQLVK